MPDYDLGRARGRVEITADTDQAQRALGDYERATQGAAKATSDLGRVEQERTRRTGELESAARRRKDAESEYKRVMQDATSSVEQQVDVEERRNRARGEHLQAARRAADAERAYQAAVDGNTDAVRKFIGAIDDVGPAHDRATRKVRDFRNEVNETERTVRVLSRSITSILAPALKALAISGAVGIGGGALGLLGAGGLQGLVAGIGGVTAAVTELSGVVALMPAVLGGAVTVLGTLAVAFHGVGDALSAAMEGDPKKFAEAIKDMGPATRTVINELAQFTQSFKGAMAAVQDSFFTPLIGVIAPLIQQWLPALMQAGQQVANVLGQAGRAIAGWLSQSSTMSGFQEFINNLLDALNRMLPAITPVLDAFLTLTRVGSQFLPQIADSITRMANAFNQFVQEAAGSGRLQQWISGSLDAFGQLFDIIKNVGVALGNIGSLSGTQGGFLDWLVQVTAQFRAWTESTEGAATITAFFTALREAGAALSPVIGIIGGALAQLLVDMTQLGTSMGPGLQSFFKSFSDALGILGQVLIQSGPAFNTILSTLGQVLLQVVQSIGPQLPGLFQDLADVLIDLAPHVATLATAIADLLSHLTPTEIEVLLGLVVAFQAIATVAPIIVAAITGIAAVAAALTISFGAAIAVIGAVVIAVGLLVAAIIYAVTHWDQVKAAAQAVWDQLKAFGAWIVSSFKETISSISDFFSSVWDSIKNGFVNLVNSAKEWGSNLIQGFLDGIYEMTAPIRDAASWIAEQFSDFWKPGSPTKRGPLSEMSTEEMGSRLAGGLATGASSQSSAVGGAASGVAGSFKSGAADTGVNPNFGGGRSGFNQLSEQIQRDLQGWLSLVRNSFGLFGKIVDVTVNSMKVVASIWNKGDNPMTQPGGPFGAPAQAQTGVPGVPQAPQHGTAPLPNLVPGAGLPDGAPVVPQTSVPGVPQIPWAGTGPPPPAPVAPGPAGPGGGTPTTIKLPGAITAPPSAPPPQAPPGRPPTGPAPAPGQFPTTATLGPEQSYGRAGVTEDRTEEGFPQWVYDVGAAFGLGPATYAGHQTDAPGGVTSGGIKVAPNPQGLNRGIDWWPMRGGQQHVDMSGQSYSPDEVARLQAFAEFLKANGLAEEVIWQNPVTGQQVGAPDYVDYSENYGGHTGHVHTRNSREIRLPNTAPAPAPGAPRGAAPPALPNVSGTANAPDSVRTPSQRFFFGDWAPWDDGPVTTPGGDQPFNPADRRGRGATPPAGPPGAPGGLGPNPTKQQIANYIINKALSQGYTRDQANSFLIQAVGESGLDPKISGGVQGVDEVIGIYQEMKAFSGGLSREERMDPQKNIDAYFTQAAAHGGPAAFQDPAQFLGREVSVGGPYHPENQAKGHLTTAQENAAPYIAGYGGAPPPGAPVPVTIQTPNGAPLFGPGAQGPQLPPPGPGAPFIGPGADGSQLPKPPPGAPFIGPGAQGPTTPTPGQAAGQPVLPGSPLGPAFAPAANLPFGATTPMGAFEGAMSGVSSIAGDAMAVFDNVIKSIGATANIMDSLVRGPSSSEDIMELINNFQQYLVTAASVAKLVGSVGSMVGGASGGMDMGAGGALSAVAGIVQGAIEAANMAIDLGQEVWHQVSKYGAIFAGHMLGGDEGFLGGNVRMLLNTATGEVYAYSEDNPMQKTTHNMPDWMARSYGGLRPETQPPRIANVSIYAGPGQTPRDMMNESMWLANNSGSAATIAAVD